MGQVIAAESQFERLDKGALGLILGNLSDRDLSILQRVFGPKTKTYQVTTQLRPSAKVKQLFPALHPFLQKAGLINLDKSDITKDTYRLVKDYLKGGVNARTRWTAFQQNEELREGGLKVVQEALKTFSDREEQSQALINAATGGTLDKIHSELGKEGVWVDAQDKNGETALHKAAYWGISDVVPTLIKHGADLNALNYDGKTPLFYAVEQRKELPLKQLIGAGADLNFACRDLGCTVIHAAAQYSDQFGLKPLIKAKANLNLQDKAGMTPLHRAADCGIPESARQLVEAGADINVQDNRGWTPLHRAVNRQAPKVVELLVKAKAHLHVRDKEGRTPLGFATEKLDYRGGPTMVQCLLDHGASYSFWDRYRSVRRRFPRIDSEQAIAALIATLLLLYGGSRLYRAFKA